MIYDGSPIVPIQFKKQYPLAKVNAYQSRAQNGDVYYDVHSGQNCLILDPMQPLKGLFAGEDSDGEHVQEGNAVREAEVSSSEASGSILVSGAESGGDDTPVRGGEEVGTGEDRPASAAGSDV